MQGRPYDGRMPETLVPADVIAAASAAEAALRPVIDRDWSVRADPADYLGRACVEILVHTDDALTGLGVAFAPPAELCQRVLAQQFPDAVAAGTYDDPWGTLPAATGRPPH
jgi:hypothetical protein